MPTITFEPEKLLTVEGGRTFGTQCAGAGSTDVFLVAGYASAMADVWTKVQPTLSGYAKVCAYDRLGIGRSDSPPDSQTFADMAGDMDRVITALGLRRPVVVVAHSLGGPVALTWASSHPKDVKGLVLLDIAGKLAGEELARQANAAPFSLEVSAIRSENERFDNPVSNVESLDPKSWAGLAALPRIGAVPLVALTAEKRELPAVEGLDLQRWKDAAAQDQRNWAAMSDHSQVKVATGSGHVVQFDRPDMVIAEVRAMLG